MGKAALSLHLCAEELACKKYFMILYVLVKFVYIKLGQQWLNLLLMKS